MFLLTVCSLPPTEQHFGELPLIFLFLNISASRVQIGKGIGTTNTKSAMLAHHKKCAYRHCFVRACFGSSRKCDVDS